MNFYMLFYPGMYMRPLESYEVGLWKEANPSKDYIQHKVREGTI
jgi:hypothetical protein